MEPAVVSPPALAAPAGIIHLERFLETVLKQSLHDVLAQRDEIRTMAAQCTQLRSLIGEMQGLSRERTFINRPDGGAGPSVAPTPSPPSPGTRATAPGKTGARQRNRILVDLGNYFYTPATIKDAGHLHVNLGCGVVLRMTAAEAQTFARRKEEVLREMAMNKTREALRLTYRIRLVTEAIARLNEREMGLRRS